MEAAPQRWLFRLADPYDYGAHGVPAALAPPAVPGRCVLAGSRLQAHVATPDGSLAEAVRSLAARWDDGARKAAVVGQLPSAVTPADLAVRPELTGEPWRLPVGVRESDLAPAVLEVFAGEHVLVAGSARSGKSSLLLGLAESVRAAGVAVWAVCGRRSPLRTAGLERCAVGEQEAPALLAAARTRRGPLVLLVDDAETFADDDEGFADLVTSGAAGLLVVAAGRSDDLRSRYAHWTRKVARARCGMLLQPDADLDGDLLGTTLPRRAPVALSVGRGYVVSGGGLDVLQAMGPAAGPPVP